MRSAYVKEIFMMCGPGRRLACIIAGRATLKPRKTGWCAYGSNRAGLRMLAGYSRSRTNRLLVTMARRLRPRQIQIPLQRIEHKAGELISPIVQLRLAPVAIQANGVGEVFRERLPVAAIADQNVSEPASAGRVINSAVCASSGV